MATHFIQPCAIASPLGSGHYRRRSLLHGSDYRLHVYTSYTYHHAIIPVAMSVPPKSSGSAIPQKPVGTVTETAKQEVQELVREDGERTNL